MTSPDAALSFQDLRFSRRTQPVFVGLRWDVPAGAFVALTGLTGSGKSTLLELASGILRPQGGQVRVLGADPARPASRKLLGYMPQGGGLYPDLTVEDNLRIFGEGAGLRPGSDLERLLELLELRKRRHEAVSSLSMGWQKRVSLGAALVTQAPVLLLDEPLAHADAAFAGRAIAHFAALAAEGRTVVVATSAPHLALRAERVAILRAGRLVQDLATAELAVPGRATVALTYQKRSATRVEEAALEDYREGIVPLIFGTEPRPFDIERLTRVEVRPDSAERRLEALLGEET